MPKIRLAIDANEANVNNRVGSNVYAFEILKQLEQLTADGSKDNNRLESTILLAQPPVKDLPQPRPGWRYQVIKPAKFWTQWAEPIHLYLNKNQYDVLFVTGHYAPRLSSVPYVSCVMDLAFIDYPDQFQKKDLFQLKKWTKYSAKKAQKVVAISQFTKQELIKHYKLDPNKILVAYPDTNLDSTQANQEPQTDFFKKHDIHQPYFLFVGTLQPRKNLERLVAGFEILCTKLLEQNQELPQLVIAGKIGWLANGILQRIEKSKFKRQIILPGFISNQVKTKLIKKAAATVLVGLYEGFGIPPLESLKLGTLPIVSNTSSLPEVVGQAGWQVDPLRPSEISQDLEQALTISHQEKQQKLQLGQVQLEKFSWRKSAQIILDELIKLAQSNEASH